MGFEAKVEVSGSPRTDFDASFFDESVIVNADTIGELFDRMVEASYTLSALMDIFVSTNFDENYVIREDYWYVTVTYPEVFNPYNAEATNGAGSALSSIEDIVNSVVHYRHMAISRFFKAESCYVANGWYRQFLPENPFKDFFEVHKEEDFNNWRHYGFTGDMMDTVISGMGQEYFNMLKDVNKYHNIIYGATRTMKFILPTSTVKESESKDSSSKLWRFLGLLRK